LYTYTDKVLRCADCNQDFVFSASEQEFYASRDFSEPRRCAACRALRKASRGDSAGSNGYGNSGGYGSREMFTATCANCGREAQVPFRPSGVRPVYCSDCFRAQRA
jgi:CxxC-x17-CxxC domain-containing protein